MQITLFARKRTTKEGKPFATFITTLTRKDGTQLTAQVKFKEDCGQPKPEKCPMNIVFEKTDGNLAKRTYTDSMGDEKEAFTLWISAWKEGDPYVDKSLDDFE